MHWSSFSRKQAASSHDPDARVDIVWTWPCDAQQKKASTNGRHEPSGSSEPCTATRSTGIRPVFPMISLGPRDQLLNFEVSRACFNFKRLLPTFAIHACLFQKFSEGNISSRCYVALILAGVSCHLDFFFVPRLERLAWLGLE